MEAVKYLYSLRPECINIAGPDGYYLLHSAIDHNNRRMDDREELTRFLLQHDQGAVSKRTNDGDLALHFAFRQPLEIVKLVFNAYPQAIHTRNNKGETPLNGWRRPATEDIFRLSSSGKGKPVNKDNQTNKGSFLFIYYCKAQMY
jgi:ankyrin repeat protein